MSVRADNANTTPLNQTNDLTAAIEAVQPDASSLAEGNSYSTAAPENPLTRRVVVSIRASLSTLPRAPFDQGTLRHAKLTTHFLSSRR